MKDNVVISEMFLQRGKIQVSETLMLTNKEQLFVLCLLYSRFFAFVDIIVFEEADSCY